ncbi:MAG: DNA-3-methyladenine glycosylase [Pseudomonadota bacterium]
MSIIPGFIGFSAPADQVARALIGATLLVDGVGGKIVETEAYNQTDPASHTFCGLTPRNVVMFGPPAHSYVYRSYGMHWCVNFVCSPEGVGAGVLIRALEPVAGISVMKERRKTDNLRLLCAGPGRVCQALAITGEYNGLPLDQLPFQLLFPHEPSAVITGPRIGISKAKDIPWRFGLLGSPFVSRPFSKS